MGHLFLYLPSFACVGGMGLCMWLMMRGGQSCNTPKQIDAPSAARPSEVTELRQEIARLRTEIQSRQNEPAQRAGPR
jgi:hypothetical protein